MKELVVVSGKGGTGKTSISAALAMLAPSKILADCDVDAANLHLVIGADLEQSTPFYAGYEPVVSEDVCIKCGKCTQYCRFDAIDSGKVSTFDCEGCGVCALVCPVGAVNMESRQAGEWLVSKTKFGALVHAELGLGVENSGKLVAKVRQEARTLAQKQHVPLIVTDGPPGIGCPAIAAISGADLLLAVVEPSLSSMHDLQRLLSLAGHFGLKTAVCINKATLNSVNTHTIIAWCNKNNIPVVGEISYSKVFRQAAQSGKTVLEFGDVEIQKQILELWYNVCKILGINPDYNIVESINRKFKSFIKR